MYATGNNYYLSLATKMASQAGAFWGGHDYGVLSWDNKLTGAQVSCITGLVLAFKIVKYHTIMDLFLDSSPRS